MSDSITFIAQAAAASGFEVVVAFMKRGGSTTDPSDQRDLWSARLVVPATRRIIAEWNGFEDRDELFETAARAVAETAARQMVTWEAQLVASAQKTAKEAAEKAAAEEATKREEADSHCALMEELEVFRAVDLDVALAEVDQARQDAAAEVEQVLADVPSAPADGFAAEEQAQDCEETD